MISQFVVALGGLGCSIFQAWSVPTLYDLMQLLIASVFSLAGHLCVIHSLRSGEISTVAPFRYTGMVWAVVFGLLLWNELPDAYSFTGILILMSAGLYTFYREQKLRRLRLQ